LYEVPSVSDPRFAKLTLGKKGIKEILIAFKVDELPESLIDLLSGMLQIDPTKRLTIHQVLEHPFLSSISLSQNLNLPVSESLSSQTQPVVSKPSNIIIHPKVSEKVLGRSEEALSVAKQLNCQKFKSRLCRKVTK